MFDNRPIFYFWPRRRLWTISYSLYDIWYILYHIDWLWGIKHIELWHDLLQHGIICLSGGKDLVERFLQASSLREHFVRQDRRERALDIRHSLQKTYEICRLSTTYSSLGSTRRRSGEPLDMLVQGFIFLFKYLTYCVTVTSGNIFIGNCYRDRLPETPAKYKDKNAIQKWGYHWQNFSCSIFYDIQFTIFWRTSPESINATTVATDMPSMNPAIPPTSAISCVGVTKSLLVPSNKFL